MTGEGFACPVAPRSRKPSVSVGVPVFNGERHVARALTALLDQTYPDIQILVSDNASTDRTGEICRKFVDRDSRIRYVRQAQNIGASRNFNYCRIMAVGDYFMWVAADDSLSRDFVELCMDAHLRDESLALVAGQIHYLRANGSCRSAPPCNLLSTDARDRTVRYLESVGENGVFYGLYRSSMISECRLVNMLGGDWLWLAEVASSGRVVTIDTATIVREDSATGLSEREYFARLARTLQIPGVFARIPKLTLCLGIPLAMFFRSAQFAKLSGIRRLSLSLAAFYALVERLTVVRRGKIRSFGRTLANRLRKL